MQVEEVLEAFVTSACNVELLLDTGPRRSENCVGVRIRPWTAQDRDKMILGSGPSLELALQDAFDKATKGRWERLDWSARPWPVSRPAFGPSSGPAAR